MRALANVRQYISPNASTWTSALEAARAMYEEFGRGEDAGRRSSATSGRSWATWCSGSARGWPIGRERRPTRRRWPRPSPRCRCIAQVAGESAQAFLTQLAPAVEAGRGAGGGQKSQVRTAALAAMDEALKDGSASQVYEARDDLVDQYADLAQRPRADRADDGRQRADPQGRQGRHDPTGRRRARPRPEPLGPPTSIVLRSRTEPASAAPAAESIVFALAEGFGYGIDAAAGAPLWQVPLGLASPFVPQPVPGEAAAIAFDARSDELVRLDARTGALAWRLELGERVADPPLVLGNQLVQVVPSGKLLLISLRDGRAPGHDEPRPAAGPHAGQRRVGPAPLRPGTPGHPLRPQPRPAGLRGGRVPGPCRRLDPVLARRCWAGS